MFICIKLTIIIVIENQLFQLYVIQCVLYYRYFNCIFLTVYLCCMFYSNMTVSKSTHQFITDVSYDKCNFKLLLLMKSLIINVSH